MNEIFVFDLKDSGFENFDYLSFEEFDYIKATTLKKAKNKLLNKLIKGNYVDPKDLTINDRITFNIRIKKGYLGIINLKTGRFKK